MHRYQILSKGGCYILTFNGIKTNKLNEAIQIKNQVVPTSTCNGTPSTNPNPPSTSYNPPSTNPYLSSTHSNLSQLTLALS